MILLKLIAANLATILFLAFTVWCLKNGHEYYAFVSFLVAACSGKTLETISGKDNITD